MNEHTWQYLGHVEPVLPTPRAGDLPDQFAPTLPDLPPTRRGLPTALLVAAASFVFAPAAPAVTLDWHPPLSTPQSVPRLVSVETGAERPIEVPEFQQVDWLPEIEDPVRPIHLRQYETWAERPAAIITDPSARLDWYQPLSEPVRIPARPPTVDTGAERSLVYAPVIAGVDLDWYQPLSEPLRADRWPAVESVSFAPTIPWQPPAAVALAWATPLAAPPDRPRPSTPSTGAESPILPPTAAITQIAWAVPLAEPVRAPRRIVTDEFVFAPTIPWQPPAEVALAWSTPQDPPVRIPPRAVDFSTGAEQPPLVPVGVGLPNVSWMQPLAEPPAVRTLPVAAIPFAFSREAIIPDLPPAPEIKPPGCPLPLPSPTAPS